VRIKSIFTLIILLPLFEAGWAQSLHVKADADLDGQMQLEIADTSLLDYSASKVVLGLTLSLSSKRDLTVEQIVLRGLRINGLPVYAAPVKQRLELHSGVKTLLPDPLPVTVYLRDLDSISPLEQAVSNGHTTVDGTAYAKVHVNPVTAMLLFSRSVEIAINLHQEMLPFTIPGGLVTRGAALIVLQAAEKGLRTISAKVTSGKERVSSFRREVMKQYKPHLMLACAHFEVRGQTDNHPNTQERVGDPGVVPFDWCGVAVATAPDLVLVPREVIEPWKFDTDIADALNSKNFSLDKSSYDLWLWPAAAALRKSGERNADAALRLSTKQFSVIKMPDSDEHKIRALEDNGKTRKISVAKRDSSSDLALLRIARPVQTLDALPAADSATKEWDSVALFRFRDGLRGNSADPELIIMPAKRNGTRIELGELVDDSVFGSPIVASEGIVGIVQDQSSGVTWAEATRVLKLDKR